MIDRGFIFATTGPGYTSLARQAARTVAHFHPGIALDLFTDQDIDDPVFSKVHKLADPETHRPRFEALERSRFDKAIFLDADLFIIASIGDIFDVLNRFDLAMAHDQRLNVPHATLETSKRPVPAAFPQFNSGVMGFRKSELTQGLIRDWREAFIQAGARIDQPALRELIFYRDLRVATLPVQYNVIDCDLIRSLDSRTTAPRVLHSRMLHTSMSGDEPGICSPRDLVSDAFWEFICEWQAQDGTLSGKEQLLEAPAFCDTHPGRKIHPGNDCLLGDTRPNWPERQWRALTTLLKRP